MMGVEVPGSPAVRSMFSVTVVLLIGRVLLGANPPTPQEIQLAVRDLGHDTFAVREQATKLLWRAGPAAETAMLEALKSSDPEVRRRARQILDRILYRIEPGAPKEILELMQRYRDGTAEEQAGVVRELLKLGSRAHPYLLRLLDAVDDDRRRRLMDQFAFDDWKILAPLMADGQEAVVERLLEKAAASQIESIIPHYTAFLALTQRADAKIAALRAAVAASSKPFDAQLLAALYRSKGDWTGVAWAGERSQQSEWVRLALMEKGDWNSLLKQHVPAPQGGLSLINSLGVRAAYQRLAGRQDEFAVTVRAIEEYASGPRRDAMPSHAAKALLINEQPDKALQLLLKYGRAVEAAELLMAQGKLGEALAESEKAAKVERGRSYQSRAGHIQLLVRLGKKKEGQDWLAALDKDMADAADQNWAERRLGLEVALGLAKQAERRVLDQLESRDGRYLGGLFRTLFPNLGARGETVWRFVRYRYPAESVEAALGRLRRLDDRQIGADEFAEIFRTAAPNSSWNPQPSLNIAFEHLAGLVRDFERSDIAEAWLKNPAWDEAPASAATLLADTLANARKWHPAADAYLRAWDRDRAAPLPCFLHGGALKQLGKDKEGAAFMQKAQRMLLGALATRFEFHTALTERGFMDEARVEADQLIRLNFPGRWFHGWVMDLAARQVHERGDYAAAAAIHERNILRLLPIGSGYRDLAGYLQATSMIHVLRAKSLLAENKKDAALREMEQAERLHPGNLNLAILLSADLEKRGLTDPARRVFENLSKTLQGNCRDFPDYANAHNQLAWLCVRCRRNLDVALEHARRAGELAPNNTSYLDTLAEVHFQRGDRAKALELAARCVKLPSANLRYYRQQLKRFETGDPKTDPAPE